VRKRSPMSWRKRQIVIGSRSRPDAWLPILFRGLNQLGLPMVFVESRQAYQALKSLATPRPITMTREGWRIWPARLGASPSSCTRCYGTKPSSRRLGGINPDGQETASSSRKERRPREGADNGADSAARGQRPADCDFNRAALHSTHHIKRQLSAQRTQASQGVDIEEEPRP
jgi:hypothetical protein